MFKHSSKETKISRKMRLNAKAVRRKNGKANRNLTWNSYSGSFKVMHLRITNKSTRGCLYVLYISYMYILYILSKVSEEIQEAQLLQRDSAVSYACISRLTNWPWWATN